MPTASPHPLLAMRGIVKRFPGVATKNPALPSQAIIKDKDTWVS